MTFIRFTKAERGAMSARLRAAREIANLTQREVAESVGVSMNTVGVWERGGVPEPETRTRLAELFKIEEATLFAELDERERKARELLGS